MVALGIGLVNINGATRLKQILLTEQVASLHVLLVVETKTIGNETTSMRKYAQQQGWRAFFTDAFTSDKSDLRSRRAGVGILVRIGIGMGKLPPEDWSGHTHNPDGSWEENPKQSLANLSDLNTT